MSVEDHVRVEGDSSAALDAMWRRQEPFWHAVFAAVWIACAYITRYSSLSALVATAVSPVVLWFLGHEKVALLFLVLTVITWWKHSANIGRLMSGTESKIGSKG